MSHWTLVAGLLTEYIHEWQLADNECEIKVKWMNEHLPPSCEIVVSQANSSLLFAENHDIILEPDKKCISKRTTGYHLYMRMWIITGFLWFCQPMNDSFDRSLKRINNSVWQSGFIPLFIQTNFCVVIASITSFSFCMRFAFCLFVFQNVIWIGIMLFRAKYLRHLSQIINESKQYEYLFRMHQEVIWYSKLTELASGQCIYFTTDMQWPMKTERKSQSRWPNVIKNSLTTRILVW